MKQTFLPNPGELQAGERASQLLAGMGEECDRILGSGGLSCPTGRIVAETECYMRGRPTRCMAKSHLPRWCAGRNDDILGGRLVAILNPKANSSKEGIGRLTVLSESVASGCTGFFLWKGEGAGAVCGAITKFFFGF